MEEDGFLKSIPMSLLKYVILGYTPLGPQDISGRLMDIYGTSRMINIADTRTVGPTLGICIMLKHSKFDVFNP